MSRLKIIASFFIVVTMIACGNDDDSSNEIEENQFAFVSCCGENPYESINVDVLNTGIVGEGWFTPNRDGFNEIITFDNFPTTADVEDIETQNILRNFIPNNVKIYNSDNVLIADIDNYGVEEGSIFGSSNYDIESGVYRYKVVINNENEFLLQGYVCAITENTIILENNTQLGNCTGIVFDPIVNLQ